MTSEGSAYGRFRRALDTGNARVALAAAADLPHVGLADALEVVLLLLDSEPSRFERAALRWHGRYCREVMDVDLTEAQAVLACLAALRGARAAPAAHALADLVYRPDLAQASRGAQPLGGYTSSEVTRFRHGRFVPQDLTGFDRRGEGTHRARLVPGESPSDEPLPSLRPRLGIRPH